MAHFGWWRGHFLLVVIDSFCVQELTAHCDLSVSDRFCTKEEGALGTLGTCNPSRSNFFHFHVVSGKSGQMIGLYHELRGG